MNKEDELLTEFMDIPESLTLMQISSSHFWSLQSISYVSVFISLYFDNLELGWVIPKATLNFKQFQKVTSKYDERDILNKK